MALFIIILAHFFMQAVESLAYNELSEQQKPLNSVNLCITNPFSFPKVFVIERLHCYYVCNQNSGISCIMHDYYVMSTVM
jgi:hypothetical protein